MQNYKVKKYKSKKQLDLNTKSTPNETERKERSKQRAPKQKWGNAVSRNKSKKK